MIFSLCTPLFKLNQIPIYIVPLSFGTRTKPDECPKGAGSPLTCEGRSERRALIVVPLRWATCTTCVISSILSWESFQASADDVRFRVPSILSDILLLNYVFPFFEMNPFCFMNIDFPSKEFCLWGYIKNKNYEKPVLLAYFIYESEWLR